MSKKIIILFATNLITLLTYLRADFNEKLQLLALQKPPEWMVQQIDKDFEVFKQHGISQESIDQSMQAFGNAWSVRYKIQSQNISYFSNDTSQFLQGRRDLILNILNKLAQAVRLPDVEIIINPLDASFCDVPSLAPVLVFSKNKHYINQVLIPDLGALINNEGVGEQIETAKTRFPWKVKKEQAFWRGASTGGSFQTDSWYQLARAKLVLLSLQYPEHLDAKFSLFVQGAESNPAMLAMPELRGQAVSQADSLKYKYLIDVDGNTCSWQRTYWILLSNSTLLKQVTDNIEWYYKILIPYEHFIPIKEDLSDLIEQINWTRKNDRKAHKIAKNATQFARENLSEEMVYLYLYLVLVKYAELQRS